MDILEGAAVATVTPFKPGGGIDTGHIYSHMQLLMKGGVQGVVPVGTNGEFPSMTTAEKKQVFAAAAGAKGNMFMIAGVGSCNLAEAVELADFAAGVGADAVLAVPPFYYKDVDESGIVDYYLRLLDRIELPLFLYNIPQFTGLEITDRIINELKDHPGLAGLKDSAGEPERTRRLVDAYPDLKIFGGSDTRVGQALSVGAAGVISGVGNIFPELLRDVWEASLIDEGLDEAAQRVRDLRLIIKSFPWIAATKHCLTLRGLPQTNVRPPLSDLDEAQRRELDRRITDGFGEYL